MWRLGFAVGVSVLVAMFLLSLCRCGDCPPGTVRMPVEGGYRCDPARMEAAE